jgi:hypothetical protein
MTEVILRLAQDKLLVKRKLILGLILLGVCAFLALNVRVGYAEPNAAPRTTGYEISWSTIDGGGGTSTSGAYSLTGTAGQTDAGATLSGGIYALAGGFWGGGGLSPSPLYLPLIRR